MSGYAHKNIYKSHFKPKNTKLMRGKTQIFNSPKVCFTKTHLAIARLHTYYRAELYHIRLKAVTMKSFVPCT